MQLNFSFHRLWLLMRKQWAERSRLYLLMAGAITGLLALAFFLWIIVSGDTIYVEPTYFFFFFGLYISGCILAGLTFSELAQRTTGIYYLSVPATQAEKLVCGILFSQVFFNAMFLAIFFLIRAIAFSFIAMDPHLHLKHIPDFKNQAELFFYLTLTYLSAQAFYVLGSVYFERFAFVKTTLAGTLVIIAFFLFCRYVIYPIAPHMSGSILNGSIKVNGNDGYWYTYDFPQWLFGIFRFVFKYMWVPVFWLAAYYRLKEKEI